MSLFRLIYSIASAGLLCSLFPINALGMEIKDMCEVQGARPNELIGTGIVVGLSGTGDKNKLAVVAQQRMLERMDIKVEEIKDLKSDNCAIVAVTAVLPPFVKEGTRIDVKVDSLHDCKSLEGGRLLETHLRPMGGGDTVYVVAQGALSVGGFNAGGGGGGGVRQNHVTAGRIPMGGSVEKEVPCTITDGERIMLTVNRPDFITANNIQKALNEELGVGCADALGAGSIMVTIPENERANLVSFIARIQDIKVESDTVARVILNEKTGTIVVGGPVMVKPCQVAHGSLTIKVTNTPLVSQPAPLSAGTTVAAAQTTVAVETQEAYLMPVEGTSAGDVAAALNKLKVTPRDMMAIFQALRDAGALDADLEVM